MNSVYSSKLLVDKIISAIILQPEIFLNQPLLTVTFIVHTSRQLAKINISDSK